MTDKLDAEGTLRVPEERFRALAEIPSAWFSATGSEARFQLITQNMRDIIVLMRPNGKTF